MSAWDAQDRRGARPDAYGAPAAAREFAWEVGWALAALLVITLWTFKRANELDQAGQRAQLAVAQSRHALTRLSAAELTERRRYLRDMVTSYQRLEGQVSWSRVLLHLARAIPDSDGLTLLSASSPLAEGGKPAAPVTLRVSCPHAARVAGWLKSEPYLAQVFRDVRAMPATGEPDGVALTGAEAQP